MAELETLLLELESLLYTKNPEGELKQFATLLKIDKDISTFFILKTIQKVLDERVRDFRVTIAGLKSSAKTKKIISQMC